MVVKLANRPKVQLSCIIIIIVVISYRNITLKDEKPWRTYIIACFSTRSCNFGSTKVILSGNTLVFKLLLLFTLTVSVDLPASLFSFYILHSTAMPDLLPDDISLFVVFLFPFVYFVLLCIVGGGIWWTTKSESYKMFWSPVTTERSHPPCCGRSSAHCTLASSSIKYVVT